MKTKISLLLTIIWFMLPSFASAQVPVGLSFGLGSGIFFASYEQAYFDKGTHFYPEISGYLDLSGIRLGVSAGLIYQRLRERVHTVHIDPYDPFGTQTDYGYTFSFIPLQAEVVIMPVKSLSSNSPVNPYFGIGFGRFIAIGDNKQSFFSISPKLGGEIILADIIALYGDIRLTFTKDSDLDGFIAVIGGRIRIPFTGN